MPRHSDGRPRRLRFVGGAMHGKKVVLHPDNQRQYRVPIPKPLIYTYDPDPDPFSPVCDIEVYERREVGFGAWAMIEVMALAGMGEPEFMRRIADIVEG